jgi:hypothetical protein
MFLNIVLCSRWQYVRRASFVRVRYTGDVNKKNVLLWVGISIAVVAFVFFVFWFLWNGLGGTPSQNINVGSAQNNTLSNSKDCIVWQFDDSTKPCFRPAKPTATTTSTIITAPSLPALVSRCNGLSVIETDECISTLAVEKQSKSLCDVLTKPEAKKSCLGGIVAQGVDLVDRKIVDTKIPSLVPDAPISTGNNTASQAITTDMNSFMQSEIAKQVGKYQEAVSHPDPRYTADGFYNRVADKVAPSLFQVSPYQVRPGGVVVVKGMGFQSQGNTLYVGDTASLSAESGDGMSFTTTIPPSVSEGSYNVYVKNSRGSTLSTERPIHIMVTNSPKPLPKITSVEPSVVSPDGTIVVRGDSLSGLEGLYTSVGWVLGSSNSINLKSLQYMKNFTESPYVKSGSKFKFAVYAKTDAGMSDEPFFFEVQF